MEDEHTRLVIARILAELDRQAQAMCDMLDLIRQQSFLLKGDQPVGCQEANLEKRRLLDLIESHREKLLEFKENWCNLSGGLSVETQTMISGKIEEISSAAKNIVDIENGNGLPRRKHY